MSSDPSPVGGSSSCHEQSAPAAATPGRRSAARRAGCQCLAGVCRSGGGWVATAGYAGGAGSAVELGAAAGVRFGDVAGGALPGGGRVLSAVGRDGSVSDLAGRAAGGPRRDPGGARIRGG